jgi:hypothetical protein
MNLCRYPEESYTTNPSDREKVATFTPDVLEECAVALEGLGLSPNGGRDMIKEAMRQQPDIALQAVIALANRQVMEKKAEDISSDLFDIGTTVPSDQIRSDTPTSGPEAAYRASLEKSGVI